MLLPLRDYCLLADTQTRRGRFLVVLCGVSFASWNCHNSVRELTTWFALQIGGGDHKNCTPILWIVLFYVMLRSVKWYWRRFCLPKIIACRGTLCRVSYKVEIEIFFMIDFLYWEINCTPIASQIIIHTLHKISIFTISWGFSGGDFSWLIMICSIVIINFHQQSTALE